MSIETDAVSVTSYQGSNIVEIRVSGKLLKADYDIFIPELEDLIRQHGKVRILFDMHDFHGWSLAAAWEDIKFDWHHFKDIERIAAIGEKAWERGMFAMCKPFTKAEIRCFDRTEEGLAREWIAEGVLAGK